jgi:hypothetical protein
MAGVVLGADSVLVTCDDDDDDDDDHYEYRIAEQRANRHC